MDDLRVVDGTCEEINKFPAEGIDGVSCFAQFALHPLPFRQKRDPALGQERKCVLDECRQAGDGSRDDNSIAAAMLRLVCQIFRTGMHE